MAEKICAVIPTHNRRAILQKGIERLRAQSCPPACILVVDNDSTDDTNAWLAAQPDVQALRQSNTGSAGAFHAGIRAAQQEDCDWVWLMDDDVVASATALQELVRATRARSEGRVFNSLCVGIENADRPCAGALCVRTDARDFWRGEYLYTLDAIRARADADGLIDSAGGQFYLGTLVHRSVVEKVGTPLAWLYTRGDEIEYGLRIMQAGYSIWSVTSSLVAHPDTPITYLDFLGARLPFEQMSALKRYYSIRNSIYLRRAYYAGQPFLPYIGRRIVGALLTEWIIGRKKTWREKWQGTLAALRGARDGIRAATTNPLWLPQEAYGI
jgi:GT2 family glycosyltransferase